MAVSLDAADAPAATNAAPAAPAPSTTVASKAEVSYPEATFTNSLGMPFKPVPGTSVLFCIWPTRVSDYQAFVSAKGRSWPKPDFKQEPNHPAVNVTWEDATAFAAWLTHREQAAGTLPKNWFYRLPTDAEWNIAIGLPVDNAQEGVSETPVYPWGTQWPPPVGAGNYSPDLDVDSFPHTSPVGSFKPNAFGLYDMGGNVWQWCQDYFNNSADYRVLRGASWRMRDPEDLLSSKRVGNKPDICLPVYGFRLVIAMPKITAKPPPSPSGAGSAAVSTNNPPANPAK